MTRQDTIANVEKIIGYVFPNGNTDQAWEALQYFNTDLAMGGDTVLKLVIIEDMLAAKFQKGAIQDCISRVGGNANLYRIGRQAGLDQCVIPHPGQRGFPIAPKTMTATVEAVIWAVYISSGNNTAAARAVMNKIGLWPET